MRYFLYALIFSLISSCSCSSNKKVEEKNWVASGGSKADATVTLTIDYLPAEIPIYSLDQARKLAIQKCKNWDFNEVEPFSSPVSRCIDMKVKSDTTWTANGKRLSEVNSECELFQIQYIFQCLK